MCTVHTAVTLMVTACLYPACQWTACLSASLGLITSPTLLVQLSSQDALLSLQLLLNAEALHLEGGGRALVFLNQ